MAQYVSKIDLDERLREMRSSVRYKRGREEDEWEAIRTRKPNLHRTITRYGLS